MWKLMFLWKLLIFVMLAVNGDAQMWQLDLPYITLTRWA